MVAAMADNSTSTVQNLAVLDSNNNWSSLSGWDIEPERDTVQDLEAADGSFPTSPKLSPV